MSGLLKEILDMVALPYKWIDEERAVFSLNDVKYGIFVDFQVLSLVYKTYNVANISFGIIKNKKFISAADLNTSITNAGKPLTVMSTVAEACIANKQIVDVDILCLAAADQAKEKRLNLYSVALSEIKSKVKSFTTSNIIYVKTENESRVMILSKVKFSEEDKEIITKQLKIDKFIREGKT
jgi:hypothetical protein